MKCIIKGNEKTFFKVENTEEFWKKVKETNINIVQINEKGIIVSDLLYKYFAEFGDYLIISNSGTIEIFSEDKFNQFYEIVEDDKTNILDKELKEFKKCMEQISSEFKCIFPKIDKIFRDSKEVKDINTIIKKFREILKTI